MFKNFIEEFLHLSSSFEKQLIFLRFFVSKNSMITFGGFVELLIYFSSGSNFLYLNGKVFNNVENLLISPYFSFMGNRGSSNKFLVSSITPECCPKAYLNPKSIIMFLSSMLNSPNG